MLQRCTNQKHPSFPRYGGRGITVCDRWRSFNTFLADMGDPPPERSLDRIDNDRGYEPSNCRWATRSEQARNQTRVAGRGVSWNKVLQKWEAYVHKDRKKRYLGVFSTESEALAARASA